jgi:hypothetical protein
MRDDDEVRRFTLAFLGSQLRIEYDYIRHRPLPPCIAVRLAFLEANEREST